MRLVQRAPASFVRPERRRKRALESNSLSKLKKQLEARTRELAEVRGHLSEALEQQTATSEVLRTITIRQATLGLSLRLF